MSKTEDKDERLEDFASLFVKCHGEEIAKKYLTDRNLMAYLNSGGFMTAPASTRFHGAYEGGLYDHSRQVAIELEALTENLGLRWKREESPFLIGMFHDLCKCDQYIAKKSEHGKTEYEYNGKLMLSGHGTKSVMILSQFMTLTEEEILCIRYHMGAYEKDDWDGFDMAIRKYPNVLYTHTADMIASKIRGI